MKVKSISKGKSRQHIKKQRHYFANKSSYSQCYDSSFSHVWMWELDCKEGWMMKNWCFWTMVLEKTLESPSLQRDQTSQSERKSILNIHWKDWYWNWSSNILGAWCKEPIHYKRHWFWERLKARGKGDERGWGGWMASLT